MTGSGVRRDGTLTGWAAAVGASAAVVTLADAVLLQRSKSYFTGGFLAVDYLQGPADVAAFIAASFIVDAGLIGLVAMAIGWSLARAGVRRQAALFAGVFTGFAGLIIADIVTYEIVRYMGDMFDFGLMFDLTGRSVSEVFAVTSSHLAAPLAMIAVSAVVGVVLTRSVHRRYRHEPWAPAASPRALLRAFALMLVAVATLTVAANASDTLENGLLRKPAGRVLAGVANTMSDVDRDGTGVVGRRSDPDPFDARVFPFAVDVPGNGIDEDGIGGDLPPDAARYDEPAAPAADWRHRPDIVLIVLESFRADVVGAQHRGRPVTPVLDALAAGGVSLQAAYSHNGYTVQSRHHLFSGSLLVLPRARTLIDDFKANGYRVGYFSGQDESFGGELYDVGMSRADVAFDARDARDRRYSTSTTPGSLAVPFTVVQERVADFLRTQASAPGPLFLYVNFHDAHFPYSHAGIESLVSEVRLPRSGIEPDARAALWETYVNTAANLDRAVGELLRNVERARGTPPGVIVTADHGESLFDEGFLGHGYALNDVQSRIPLVVNNLPLALEEPFAQSDLRGAIAAALRQPPQEGAKPEIRPRTSATILQYLGDLSRPRQIAVLQEGGRLIYDFRSGRVQLPDGASMRPGELDAPQRDRFLRLVWQWEAMQLARRGAAAPVE
jgi:glucan phosphoethanolaminetransferase (alkaline phosphatase superfamily)